MTFHTPTPWTESAHRNLTKFGSDVAPRVQAGALDASVTRACVRKQPPKRHNSACSHGAADSQARHDRRGHGPVSCCTHRPELLFSSDADAMVGEEMLRSARPGL